MGGITVGAGEDYLYSMLPPRDEVLAEMEAEAARRKVPIVGPAVGRILDQPAMIMRAKNAFEMGPAIGYTTSWSADTVRQNGPATYALSDTGVQPPALHCNRSVHDDPADSRRFGSGAEEVVPKVAHSAPLSRQKLQCSWYKSNRLHRNLQQILDQAHFFL